MKRRKSCVLFAALLVCLTASAQGNPKVKVAEGTLEGSCESGINVFRGVPFAAPPVGQLRWQAPQPAAHWQGVRQAKEFGPNPMQEPLFGDMDFGTKKMSEDCLYLNIWTPAKTFAERLPVLIYFNGGGLLAGSGSEPRYAGMSMARHGIVAITANYREGIFGNFAHPQLSKETSYKGSGDYGFLDQAAAIRWVHDNIASFGGDPERITIVGESAGSVSVSALMASPLCKGLIAQAMGSSGSVLSAQHSIPLKEAERQGVALMRRMGKKSIEELRLMPAEQLMKEAHATSMAGCVIDGHFMPKDPVEIYANGEQAQVPLLVGGNNMESPLQWHFGGRPATLRDFQEMARTAFGGHADDMLRAYGINSDSAANSMDANQLLGDLFIGFRTWKWGDMHARSCSKPVYRYLYCHPRPAMRVAGKVGGLAGGTMDAPDGGTQPQFAGAVHSADIEYAMGNLPTNRVYDWQPEDFVVSDIFMGFYVNFIKTGNPNGLGLPEWTPTNGRQVPPVMQIDVNPYQKTDAAVEDRYRLLDSIYK